MITLIVTSPDRERTLLLGGDALLSPCPAAGEKAMFFLRIKS